MEICPGKWADQVTYWGLTQERQVLLAGWNYWLDSWWDLQEGYGKPRLWLWGALAVSWKWIENSLNGFLYCLQSSPGTCSSLNRAKALASLISHYTGTQDSHWAEGKPWLTPGSSHNPSISSPTSSQGSSSQDTLQKDVTCAHQIQLCCWSHWVHADCIGMLPYKGNTSRLQ